MSALGEIDLRPVLGDNSTKRDRPTFLFVVFFDPNGINTVYQNIANWQRHSCFNINVINLWPNRAGGTLALPASVDLSDYDGVILHPTTAYFPANLIGLDRLLDIPFENYEGIKVLVKQDEHYHTAAFSKFIADKHFDVLVTCVPADELEKAYPKSAIGNVTVVHALTGYVAPELRHFRSVPYESRAVDVAYRGSVQPLSFGRLGFEKRKIGYDVSRAMAVSDLRTDVSSRWEDRIGGNEWMDFLGNAKIVLGVESGSNLFDFDGKVERWCEQFAEKNREMDPASEDYFEKAYAEYLHRFEGNVNYAQISPRHFEAAAARSVQLLYDGQYSGIFLPDRHYLSLKRDLSNLEECLDILNDVPRARELTTAAFEEIILNDAYKYEQFVENVDEVLAHELEVRKGRAPGRTTTDTSAASCATPSSEKPRPRALMLMSHDPQRDPRIDWVSCGFENRGFEVVEIGFFENGQDKSCPAAEAKSILRKRIRIERTKHDHDYIPNPAHIGNSGFVNHYIPLFWLYSALPKEVLAKRIGAQDASDADVTRFRWYCDYVFNSNAALLQAARLIGQFDVVVSADIDVLPVTLLLSKEYNAVSVFDAHEYWTGVFSQTSWEYEFWSHVESNLVRQTDVCMTVSPPLGRQFELEYGVQFLSVPNCERRASTSTTCRSKLGERDSKSDKVVFLFQGNFHPERPVDRLIKAWAQTNEKAVLMLRGPHWSYRDELMAMAKSTGLLGTRIFFSDAVKEEELVRAAREADVGIIPYDPKVHAGYRYACPNKLSQYMAAGLPILSSPIEYVAQTVKENQLGLVFDLEDAESLIEKVNKFVEDREFREFCSENALRYFEERFNWDEVSKPFYDEVISRVERLDKTSRRPLAFDWISRGRSLNKVNKLLDAETARGNLSGRLTITSVLFYRLKKLLPTAMKAALKRSIQEGHIYRVRKRLKNLKRA